MSDEIWKPVVGAEAYFEVSNHGRVKSLERFVCNYKSKTGFAIKPERIMKPCIGQKGYLLVCLSINGKRFTSGRVHQLVAKAFLPPPNGYKEINHINGIKTDNRVENLEWLTHSQNCQHAVDKGLSPKGSGCKSAKLNEHDVVLIKRMFIETKRTCKQIADEFGVAETTINSIRRKIQWKHVLAYD